MNAVLPLIPNTAPATLPDPGPQRETPADGETFASVLDRQTPAGNPQSENREEACAQCEVTEPESAEAPERTENEESDETLLPLPPPTLGLMLPALPYHPVEAMGIVWNPTAADVQSPESSEESSAGPDDAGTDAAGKPEQIAGPIFTAPSPGLPIFTAAFPVPMAQLRAQLQVRPETPAATLPPAMPPDSRAATLPPGAESTKVVRSISETSILMPPMVLEFASAMRMAPESPTAALPAVREFAPGVYLAPESPSGSLPMVPDFAPPVRYASGSPIGRLPMVSDFTPVANTAPESPVAVLPVIPESAPAMRAQTGTRTGTLPLVSEFASADPATPLAGSIALPAAGGGVTPLTQDTVRLAPRPQRERPTLPTIVESKVLPQRAVELPIQADAPATETAPTIPAAGGRAATEISLVENAPPPHGTPAAKRGEVMHDIAFQPSPNPRVGKSTGEVVIPQGLPELPLESETAQTPPPDETQSLARATSMRSTRESGVSDHPDEAQALGPATIANTADRKEPGHRPAREVRVELREAPSTGVQPSAVSASESGATLARAVQAATTVDRAARSESEPQPATETPVKFEANVPSVFPTPRPQADRVTTEAVTADAPINRTELVHIVDRTADAAVRMRAADTERVEVAVQLASGDRLTIQLRIANGEVTPYFRTTSDGLRTALEQNWGQFSERASDRGVRMTPPVFDANQSSSNMSDLSQQRHGRDTAYTDAQAELFPHLPRRMRPPRVMASAPRESSPASAAGVRTYA